MSAPILPPYARSMGMVFDHDENGSPVIAMDFSDRNTGRPGFLHGGAIGGLLEMAAFAALHAHLDQQGIDADIRLKPVNISIEYLRSGLPQRIFARGVVVRAGRRVANVRAEAWQSDRDKAVASCWMNFLLAPRKVPVEG
ncbi:PaaI family thioesterase [Novosphingobium sp. KCTC 2891]|uniref:PaaI family thioesterase n=1 Tax=Novosphingobium sp. KCTC 2891 TaxID=2989730 RepID=UPI0022226BD6|nr:PaaI family thioesterase [Novosphingobium sp. KCTC 2891]MCW1382557.1 PaaI family thioesterase [Novosphingobium sp. KCTC 2891]